MPIFQCQQCGCAENSALGWYNNRNKERLTVKEHLGKALCSACAPRKFPDGSPTKFNGKWHNSFERTFLPLNLFKTNEEGKLEHIETGEVGNVCYEKYKIESTITSKE